MGKFLKWLASLVLTLSGMSMENKGLKNILMIGYIHIILYLDLLMICIRMLIILLIFMISIIQCIQFKLSNNVCYPKAGKAIQCHGKHSYNCADYVCIKNQYSCHILSLFSHLKGIHQEKYQIFMKQIKECPEPPKYKWRPADVCLNTKICFWRYIISINVLTFGKSREVLCECNGKYSFKCKGNYCSLNKLGCDGLVEKNVTEIKKCP